MNTLNVVDQTSQFPVDFASIEGTLDPSNPAPSNKKVYIEFTSLEHTSLSYEDSIGAVMPRVYSRLSSKEACRIRNIFWALFRSSDEYKKHPEYHNCTVAQIKEMMAKDQRVSPDKVSCPEALQQISHIDEALQATLKEIARLHGFIFEVNGEVFGDLAKFEQTFALEGMSYEEKIKILYSKLYFFAKSHNLQNLPSIEAWRIDTYQEIFRVIKCQDILTIWENLPEGKEHIEASPSLKEEADPKLLEEALLQWLRDEKHPQRREITQLSIKLQLYHFPTSLLKELSSTLTSINLKVKFIHLSEFEAPNLTCIGLRGVTIKSFEGANFPKVRNLYLYFASIHSFQGSSFPQVTQLNLNYSTISSFEGANFPLVTRLKLQGVTIRSFQGANFPAVTELDLSKAVVHSFQDAHFLEVTHLNLNYSTIESFKGTYFPKLTEVDRTGISLKSWDGITCLNLSWKEQIDLRGALSPDMCCTLTLLFSLVLSFCISDRVVEYIKYKKALPSFCINIFWLTTAFFTFLSLYMSLYISLCLLILAGQYLRHKTYRAIVYLGHQTFKALKQIWNRAVAQLEYRGRDPLIPD